MRLGIVGSGVVGNGFGRALEHWGNEVVYFDVDGDVLSSLAGEGRKIAGTITDLVGSTDSCFVCVPTPYNNGFDLKFVREAAQMIGSNLKDKDDYYLVVLKSTCLPGTTEDVFIPALESLSGRKAHEDFGVCYNPEFLRSKFAFEDSVKPIRTVVGEPFAGSKEGNLLEELFAPVKSYPFFRTSLKAAEMIKYSANSFYAARISFMNQLFLICTGLGVNSQEVVDALLSENYGIGMEAHGRKHGRAYDGACLPKDVKALIDFCEDKGIEIGLLKKVDGLNELMKKRFGTWE